MRLPSILKYGAVAAIALSGCATNRPNAYRPLRPLELATAPSSGVMTSAVTGSLSYEGGCLMIQPDESKAPVFPIWPQGSTFNGTSVIFHQPGKADQPLVIGQEARIEGRAMAWSALPDARYRPFEHQCGGSPFLVSGIRPAD